MSAGSPDAAGGATRTGEIRSYHDQPVLKQPVWTWEIPCYFYVGGAAGASAGLAYLSELRGEDVLARRAWATALVGVAASPALLTSDLGRPERFINMLRLFKVTSPMSAGSWILTASGASTAVAAIDSWSGLLPRAGEIARPLAALLGLPLSTYTAAVLANTAVPAWRESRRLLPFVFAAGAALSAGAAGVAVTPPSHAGPARRLGLAGAASELGLTSLMLQQLGEHGDPYKHGTSAKLRRLSQACIMSGAMLLYRRGGSSRAAAIAAGALLSGGALGARWSIFKAGFQSASDPRYVVAPQRARIQQGERLGAARFEPRLPVGESSA